ncbi:MAG: tetratricopeptide repeat protein, partial [Verrucomicrobiales bacterium]
LSRDDDSSSIHFNLALALERQKNLPAALEEYRRAIELDPTITVAHLNRGAILSRSNDPSQLESGIVALREAVRLNPNLAASHYHLGLALERSGQFPDAFKHYRQASLLAPDHLGNAMQLAHLLERAGKLESALTEYQKIYDIHPQSAQAAFQIGAVFEKLSRPGEAAVAYRNSLRQQKNYVPALNNLAWMLATTRDKDLRDPSEALKLAELAARETRFESAAILDTLATAQFAAGDKAAAIATLKKAIPLAAAADQTAFSAELAKKLSNYQGPPAR